MGAEAPRGRVLAQLLASVLVFGLLLREAELDRVLAALEAADLRWLAVAVAAKATGMLLHEVRLWLSTLPFQRTSALRAIAIGLTAGLLNAILPFRAGDIIAVALLRSELGLSGAVALAAVGITTFLEAGLFAIFLLGLLVVGATRFEEILGAASTARATSTVALAVAGSVIGAGVLVALARRLRGGGPTGPGPVHHIRSALVAAGEGLGAWRILALNLGLGVIQVAAIVFSFQAGLPAAGIEVPAPTLAACGIIAVGSLASIVLPPTFGAGPAAAAVFVLGALGVDEAQALAYTALGWIVNTGPAVGMGLIPALRRAGSLTAIWRGRG